MKKLRYVDEFRFEVSCEEEIRCVNIGDRRMSMGMDLVFFHLHFEPKKTFDEGEYFTVSVFYQQQKHPCLTLTITHENPLEMVKLEDRLFFIYPTYQLEIARPEAETQPEAASSIKTVFVTLENNNLAFEDLDDGKPLVQPRIDGFKCDPRLKSLPYIPLHPNDPIYENKTLEKWPQRIPLWYYTKNEEIKNDRKELIISGTVIEKYICGYWVERNAAERNESKNVFELLRERRLKGNNFRYGRLMEAETMMIVMHNMPEIETFEECGRITFPVPEWLLDKIPEPDKLHFACSPDASIARAGGSSIVLEYKASYHQTSLPGYYIPQLYWEMMATNSQECRLVRYKRVKCQNMRTGVWHVKREASMYVVRRDPEVEKRILDTLCYTLNMLPFIDSLDTLSSSSTFVAMKLLLDGIARATPETHLTIPLPILLNYETYRTNILKACSARLQ